jgi:hypothetical protein
MSSGGAGGASDWGGDYSMILHNIEDNLDYHITHRKRPRGGKDDVDLTVSSSGEPHDLDTSMSFSVVNSSSSMRLNLQIDELKLQIEELNEKLRLVKDDQMREKEKMIRQLQFLENDNTLLKNEIETKNEKYYALKKKLQSTLREKQSTTTPSTTPSSTSLTSNSSLHPSSASSLSSPLLNEPQSKGGGSNNSSNGDHYIKELETTVLLKNKEVRHLTLKNSELEEKCGNYEQQLLTLRADFNSTESTANSSLSSLLTHKQKTDSDNQLRKQGKEIERLVSQLKNQQILEEELNSSQQKIIQLKQSVKSLLETESRYSALMEEKESWSRYFRDVIQHFQTSSPQLMAEINSDPSLSGYRLSSHEGVGGESADASSALLSIPVPMPIMILRYLNKLQNKCIELLRNECDLELKNSELKAKLSSTEKVLDDERKMALEDKETIQSLQKRFKLLTQHSILYESEVMSLRALLKTYDLEFNVLLGNTRQATAAAATSLPTTRASEENKMKSYDKALSLKDSLIAELREELDRSREEFKQRLQQLEADLALSSTSGRQHQVPGQDDEIVKLKSQFARSREEIFCLQSLSRVDFIPDQTKVYFLLHIVIDLSYLSASQVLRLKRQYNPSYAKSETVEEKDEEGMDIIVDKDQTPSYMTPIEELKALRKEIKTLKSSPHSAALALSDDLSTSVVGPSTASSSSGIDSNKLNIRLKEMFRERISSYREAVYLLLGYKVPIPLSTTL